MTKCSEFLEKLEQQLAEIDLENEEWPGTLLTAGDPGISCILTNNLSWSNGSIHGQLVNG